MDNNIDAKNIKLQKLLLDLSDRNTRVGDCKQYIESLKEIYGNEFRHSYSHIFGVISSIRGDMQRDLQRLSNNIEIVRDRALEINKQENVQLSDEICTKIVKLHDHVSLDIARLEYTEDIVNDFNRKNEDIFSNLKLLEENAKGMQKEYTTILGIFAAIILAFVAGITFSTAVLSNIDKVSIYRLVFVVCLIAMMLFNLLNLLLAFLNKINGRRALNIQSQDEWDTASVIKAINIYLCILLLADFILWAVYWYRISHPDLCLNSWFPI